MTGAPRDVNLRMWKALGALDRAPGGELRGDELARDVGPYATNTLKSLVTRGLASWRPANGDRHGLYTITERGRARLTTYRAEQLRSRGAT